MPTALDPSLLATSYSGLAILLLHLLLGPLPLRLRPLPLLIPPIMKRLVRRLFLHPSSLHPKPCGDSRLGCPVEQSETQSRKSVMLSESGSSKGRSYAVEASLP